MMTTTLLLIAVLSLGPDDGTVVYALDPPDAAVPALDGVGEFRARWAIRNWAVRSELVSPDERLWVPYDADAAFADELAWVRDLWHRTRDCPRIADAARLPPRPQILAWRSFNRAVRSRLATRREWEIDRREELGVVIAECDALFAFWDAADDARTEHLSVGRRRQQLGRMRALIGEDRYDRGEWPPAWPVWRFRELGD